ncbi:class I SAM-dependent methyltransferase [Acidocella facilis]|uniref:class I SAM-dependent methyltransferase n=1 Tax=Acidocella facilis TaxID=525 RepID=UPI00047D8E88|nr:class I SAM-dependent methyltransferase [Acidocella facilis]
MSQTEPNFAATHYAPRADAYVQSAVHAGGADLDEMEALLRARVPACVLDLGCGGGHVSYRAAPYVNRVVACDVTPAMLEAVARTASERGLGNIETRLAAAEALPFEDGLFDAVLCRFTAHHWADVPAGLRAARRVSKTGAFGVFIDTVAPAKPVLDSHLQTMELLRDPSHGRNYSVAEWGAMLAQAGFGLRGVTVRRLRMEFASWVARTATPAVMQQAIRALQQGAPEAVKAYFAIAEDGSFDLEVATMIVDMV